MKSTIVITGASKGIGNFLFNKFSNKKYKIYGTYHQTSSFKLKHNNSIKLDITKYNEVSGWVKSVKNDINRIILINCAGTNY